MSMKRWWLLLGLSLALGCSKKSDAPTPGPTGEGARFSVEPTGKKFVFRLYADDTQVLLESDPYAEKSSAKSGIKALRKAFDRAKCFRHRIVVKAKNGQPLARSPKYPDKQRCEDGLAMARKVIRKAR